MGGRIRRPGIPISHADPVGRRIEAPLGGVPPPILRSLECCDLKGSMEERSGYVGGFRGSSCTRLFILGKFSDSLGRLAEDQTK